MSPLPPTHHLNVNLLNYWSHVATCSEGHMSELLNKNHVLYTKIASQRSENTTIRCTIKSYDIMRCSKKESIFDCIQKTKKTKTSRDFCSSNESIV